ncbi:MAG: NAD(P)/FAD-dependent oxidoreductase [Paracoccus sp. (in: a-proteobacteria)]|uniref:NAD(P)/FAD-dependent oxidoreductase n=2 Tax=Paracoccus sp. TaxID=267 RepID=UPI0025DEFD9A|nr:FAD-dependent oxidoreductase [Paracoccus sp. (in: a-proteobacteria)]
MTRLAHPREARPALPGPRRRIAVIGSGISGLGTAWLLDSHHDVTLFEAEPRAGGHTRTVEAMGARVDTGFIVCNRRTYPLFVPLLEHLGVALERSDMTFSASFGGGRYEYGTGNTAALFAQRRRAVDPRHLLMLRDILRFFRHATRFGASGHSLGAMLDELRLGADFRDMFLLPISGAIWSTPSRAMLDFPAASFVRFFDNHGLLSPSGQPNWLTVTGGARAYVDAILTRLKARVALAAPVFRVIRDKEGVTVVSPHGPQRFDRAVFACHAPQALEMLDHPDAEERAVLSVFRTQPNRMVLHSDPAFMPRRPAAWAAWNYITARRRPDPHQPVSLSYWMNRLQNLKTESPLIVTLNPETEPRGIHDEALMAHPQFDTATMAAQVRLPSIQGRGGVYYAGAWTRYGFHEDGLLSALRVAQAMGIAWPLGQDPWADEAQAA